MKLRRLTFSKFFIFYFHNPQSALQVGELRDSICEQKLILLLLKSAIRIASCGIMKMRPYCALSFLFPQSALQFAELWN